MSSGKLFVYAVSLYTWGSKVGDISYYVPRSPKSVLQPTARRRIHRGQVLYCMHCIELHCGVWVHHSQGP